MRSSLHSSLKYLRQRTADERGFTLFATLLVLVVTTLLVGAMFLALNGDSKLSQHDLDSKRAYNAAEAGANAYLYQLNQNPNYWDSCANDTLSQTQVPGTSPPEYYSYKVLPANGFTTCTSNNIAAFIDSSTGSLRMEFTGYSGNPSVQRTIVAQYRKLTPLDFAWYTVYEALDSSITGYSGCNVFYRAGRNGNCNINWITGDSVKGPMYTQDQYLIDGSPTFGGSTSDKIESLAPAPNSSNNGNYICSGDNCGGLNLVGTAVPNAPLVPLPSDNSQLLTDATNNGKVYTGITTIQLGNPDGNHAKVTNCPSTCTTTTVDLTQYPLIYVQNGTGCNLPSYDPTNSTYLTSGCVGDAYVYGNYTTPLTIASANNIIVDGNVTTTQSGGIPTGSATLGLVANQYIRVMHGCTNGNNSGNSGQGQVPASFNTLEIDAAVLGLKHSFIVDNFNCGNPL
ncbi:MAG: hypothetical protein JO244_14935, partial [Solirubrobacterales bacterium]|nr:hypothetical protein [Solirubrobacterales bacterium]